MIGLLVVFLAISMHRDNGVFVQTMQTMRIDGEPHLNSNHELEVDLVSRGGENRVTVTGNTVLEMIKAAKAEPGPEGRLEVRATYETIPAITSPAGYVSEKKNQLKTWRPADRIEMW
jgi:hypothetical protein